jgi:hypothetical protein
MRPVPILFAAALVLATGAPAAAQRPPDLSGMWVVQDPGSGSWSDWYDNVPTPALRPEIVADNLAIRAREAAGEVVNRAERLESCPVGNLPMTMASSPPLNIVQSRDEILIGSEANRSRFVYTDGRSLPDVKSDRYVTAGTGYSVGRWQGATLVIETTGFPARVCDSRRPVIVTPGMGRAKETTRLTERVRMLDDETIEWTFTWEDPTVFLEPHTYSYQYKKLPGAHPFEGGL